MTTTDTTKREADIASAIATLDSIAKHWRLQCENGNGKRRGYTCTVQANGKRFTVHRATPVDAAIAAIDRIHGRDVQKRGLRLVGGSA